MDDIVETIRIMTNIKQYINNNIDKDDKNSFISKPRPFSDGNSITEYVAKIERIAENIQEKIYSQR